MNKEYFFISKPRCASTHIYEGLTNWDDTVNGSKLYYHMTAQTMKNMFKNTFDHKFSFAVVRNPYDLVLSWYNEHKKNKYNKLTRRFYEMPLEEWIDAGCRTHWNHLSFNPLHQYKWVCNNNGKLLVSHIMKLENYDKEIVTVCKRIQIHLPKDVTTKKISGARRNASLNKYILTNKQKNQIYTLFKNDFDLFGYSK